MTCIRIVGYALAALAALGSSAGCSAPSAAAPSAARPLPYASAGYILHDRSPIAPYCHGVLIAPDVVVTAADCAVDSWSELSFGVGAVLGGTIRVVDALFHPEAGHDSAHALVALVLEQPVTVLSPASLREENEPPCDVEVPAYDYALEGVAAARRVWTACAIDEQDDALDPARRLVAMDGFPGCHGDVGAGAFVTRDRERLIGWVTGAGHLGPRHPVHDVCVTSVELATVTANRAFLRDALRLSASYVTVL